MSIIVKRRGHKEKFDQKKVYGSVYAACASAHCEESECEKTADAVTKKIIKFVSNKKSINSDKIHGIVKKELLKKNEDLAFYYEQHLPDLKKL